MEGPTQRSPHMTHVSIAVETEKSIRNWKGTIADKSRYDLPRKSGIC